MNIFFLLILLVSRTVLCGSPEKVITLAPSLTETVCFIGGSNRLCAVSTHCVFPPEIQSLPKAGGYQGINYEKILLLQPDIVFGIPALHDAEVNFRKLGIPYCEVAQDSIEDIYHSMLKIGRVLGLQEQAGESLFRLKRKILSVKAESSGGLSVLIVIGHLPGELRDIYAAGQSTFLGEMITILGCSNAYSGAIQYPRVSVEQILHFSPDVIVLLNESDCLTETDKASMIKPWMTLSFRKPCSISVLAGSHVFIPGPRFSETLDGLKIILDR
ncbi:MAG: helical backbone metal receptor [Candidatus Wallbacteria bacterium]|nr:helical backbone metal receptor [Candidatus Wallbacteria bacterium]